MTILDSNIWIAYLNKNDQQHARAVRIFNKIDDEILLTEYIILEVTTVLSMRVDKLVADEFLQVVRDNQDIEILSSSGEFFDTICSVFLDYSSSNLSWVDLSLLALSQKYEVKTFDKDLAKAIRKEN